MESTDIKYSSYTESQKKATKKYRIANKDKINEMRKAYYAKRKENDKDFIDYKRKMARIYYQRKKALNQVKVDKLVEIIDNSISSNVVEPIIEIIAPIIEPIIKKVVKSRKIKL